MAQNEILIIFRTADDKMNQNFRLFNMYSVVLTHRRRSGKYTTYRYSSPKCIEIIIANTLILYFITFDPQYYIHSKYISIYRITEQIYAQITSEALQ
jgi:hypothetical protein